jgi:hypothetical protein
VLGEAADAEPIYLEFADALELYAAIIDATPAQAADQLRDRAGLESALGRPRNFALYQDADLALQAAALAHSIAESQTFVDATSASHSSQCSRSWKSTASASMPPTPSSHAGSSTSPLAQRPSNSHS